MEQTIKTLEWAADKLFWPLISSLAAIILYHQKREWFHKATAWAISKKLYAGLEIQEFTLQLNGRSRGHNFQVHGALLVRNKLDSQIVILDPHLVVEGRRHDIRFAANSLGGHAAQSFAIPTTHIEWPPNNPVEVRINIRDNSGGRYSATTKVTLD